MLKTKQFDRLASQQYRNQQEEILIDLSEITVSRREIASLFKMTSVRAFRIVDNFCAEYHITSARQLADIGLQGLLDTEGVGEVTALAVANIIGEALGSRAVDVWIEKENAHSIEGAVRHVKVKARRRAAHQGAKVLPMRRTG